MPRWSRQHKGKQQIGQQKVLVVDKRATKWRRWNINSRDTEERGDDSLFGIVGGFILRGRATEFFSKNEVGQELESAEEATLVLLETGEYGVAANDGWYPESSANKRRYFISD